MGAMRETIALTGGIASGKTAVSNRFAALGAVIVDADVLAREVVAPGTPGLAAIVRRFGRAVLDAEGSLDRAALGRVVFADATARADLNAIVHPAVRDRRADLLAGVPSGAIVIQVIPLLVETDAADDFDLVIVVDVPVDVQLDRLMARNGYSRAEAESRVAAQASRAERLAVADIVIENTGSLADLHARVDEVWRALVAGETGGSTG